MLNGNTNITNADCLLHIAYINTSVNVSAECSQQIYFVFFNSVSLATLLSI